MLIRTLLALSFALTMKCTFASSLNDPVASIPVGSILVLQRQLAVNRGVDSLELGINGLQAGFNKGFQWNNQQLGQPLFGTSWQYRRSPAIETLSRWGESAQKSYEDCKERYREYYWEDKTRDSITIFDSEEGLFKDGTIRRRSTSNNGEFVPGAQGDHPCVAPTYTQALLLVDRRQSGGTFRSGYQFEVRDVSNYLLRGEYVLDIELDSEIAHTLRIVSSEPTSTIQLQQLIGQGMRSIGGGYFSLKLPETRYYE